ncbi:alpha-hydroxy-acid oxidizing protein [Treponema sp. HNW]|uniref:alpha-hydroxy-acid oxidizing protein n=1 Tax=Treponema sp. HNW TaxID=3116654 RepID=UPI003D0F8D0C
MNAHTLKCHFCPKCDGFGCINELPGMGGFGNNINFQLNCAAWAAIPVKKAGSLDMPSEAYHIPAIRLAPITGAVENVGYKDEESFYIDIIHAADEAGVKLAIGDGCPDIKLLSGIKAVEKRKTVNPRAAAAVFIKPYPNERILERFEWSRPVAEIIGVDIDSYNILTMRRLVQLEKKSAEQLAELKKKAGIPFAVKGVFNAEEVDMVKKLKPDIVVISNHGGRVENRTGSTAEFLAEYGSVLKANCAELWVDGGIRTHRDILAAGSLGVCEVMIGRPFISALCASGAVGVKEAAKKLRGEQG